MKWLSFLIFLFLNLQYASCLNNNNNNNNNQQEEEQEEQEEKEELNLQKIFQENSYPLNKRKFLTYSFHNNNNNNKTIYLNNNDLKSSLNSYNLAQGSLKWLNYTENNSNFYVLNSLLKENEIQQLLDLLTNSSLIYDEDADSVDKLATHEIYIQRNGNIEGVKDIEGKLDQFDSIYNERLPFREKFNQIIQPIINERILPFVNEYYSDSCGLSGQKCYVCHSLVRKYLPEERASHPAHFDTHALVTGVIALNSYGKDFEGGIYVSVGANPNNKDREKYIGLQAGDALFHQSNLLHGVRVESGTRWSWIVWIKDTKECSDNSLHWTLSQALSGDSIAQYIHSKRSFNIKDKVYWLNQSVQSLFPLAANELGLLYYNGNGGLPKNITEAKRLFLIAKDLPEAYFNLGLISIQENNVSQAIYYFKNAVYLGEIAKAAQNIGVAYFHGRSVQRDLLAAVAWFERAGTGDSLMLAAQILSSNDKSLPKPNYEHILHLYRRSANAGHSPASLYLGKYYKRNNDLHESIKWFMKSARQGNEEARELLRSIQESDKQMKIDSQDKNVYDNEEDEKEEDEEVDKYERNNNGSNNSNKKDGQQEL